MAQFISLYVRKQQSGFPSRVITDQGVQPRKAHLVISLKFQI